MLAFCFTLILVFLIQYKVQSAYYYRLLSNLLFQSFYLFTWVIRHTAKRFVYRFC